MRVECVVPLLLLRLRAACISAGNVAQNQLKGRCMEAMSCKDWMQAPMVANFFVVNNGCQGKVVKKITKQIKSFFAVGVAANFLKNVQSVYRDGDFLSTGKKFLCKPPLNEEED